MNYLFAGPDNHTKESKISEIKKNLFSSPDELNFDFEVLYGDKLHHDDLKKALIALPALSKKRLVLIRLAEKMNLNSKQILLDFLSKKYEHASLILDCESLDLKSSFFNKLKPFVKLNNFGKIKSSNVFDVTNAILEKNASKALQILRDLLSNGDHPLQIMGGLVWFWGNNRNRLSKDAFKKGLLILQEADLNIKRSRLKPEYAIELVIVRLSSLII